MPKKIFENINGAALERQVENVYNSAFREFFPDIEISYPYACDGYFETDVGAGEKAKVICEFKHDLSFDSKTERSKVLARFSFT